VQIAISKGKALFYMILSTLIGITCIVFGGYWIISGEVSITKTKFCLFLSVGTVMSTYAYAQFQVVRSSSVGLLLSPEGLIDNSTLPNDILIKWSEVKTIEYPAIDPPPHFSVLLKDDSEFFSHLDWFSNLYFRITKFWYKTPIVLVLDNLKCSTNELKSVLQDYSTKYV